MLFICVDKSGSLYPEQKWFLGRFDFSEMCSESDTTRLGRKLEH